ncbi:porin family protein [Telluribacter sp.]|jgi:outer membrane protein W|uniref:porin family protein n=1 Tax=Telluribacter sp. TaxID=1978767 RepID=UPI002E104C03|nr:porin family protein [Telluribacter sp.]
MKKILFLSTAVLFFAAQTMAQENLSFGPMVGVSIANLRGDIANNNWKPGVTVGGFINYSAESGFGVTGNLLYTQLGAQTNNRSNELNLNYVQLPVLLTYYLGERGNPVRPKLFLGPNFNFLVGATDVNGNNIYGDSNNRVYSTFDVGATFGAGLNVRVAEKIWLNSDVRYGLGFLDVNKLDPRIWKNQNWGINLGVSFPLGTYNSTTGTIR